MNFLKRYIGDKKFYKYVFSLIIPIMLQQLLISVAGYVDNIMINNYTVDSSAYNGVNAANRLMFVLNFVWLGCAAVSSIFISQFYGSGNKKKNEEAFRLGFLVSLVMGIISMFVIMFIGNKVVDSYLTTPEAREFGYHYLEYIKYGAIITSLNTFFANSFRSIEKPKIALISSTAGIFVNIFFNYCLIYGKLGMPEMGAGGAALATVISRFVEAFIFIYFLFIRKDSYFRKSFSSLKITSHLSLDYLKKGVPLVFNELYWALGMVLLAKFYTYNNDTWYSAYGYSQNITDLFFIIFAGLGSGTAIVIGTSLGRSDFEKAEDDFRKLKGLAVILGLTSGILMIITAPLIVKLFDPSDEIRLITIRLVQITGIFTAIYCFNSVCFFTMRAGGDNIRAVILDESPTYVIALPLAILFGLNAVNWGLSIIEIYIITHISDIFKIFLAVKFTNQKKWVVNLTTKHA